jgi:hypothetical protein
MTLQMDDRYARALREALIDHVQTAPERRQRAGRRLALGVAAGLLLVVAAAAAAAAAGILRLPGSPDVEPLAQSVTLTGVGTKTVELDAPPAGTTELEVRLACLTAGTFLTADGASLVCDASSAGTGAMDWHLAVALGEHTTVITAGAGERWRLVATYSRATDTEWGVNADGLTFGVANDRGTPDLVAAIASNGKVGYVYSRDTFPPTPTSLQIGGHSEPRTIPVYTSDGHTVIGQQMIGVGASAAP